MTRSHAGREKWSVLLAEDNDDHALLITMALERASRIPVEVHRARNGDEAVSLVHELLPDLLLLDLKMPGRSGHEVLEAVKGDDELRRIPVAVLTSSDRTRTLRAATASGATTSSRSPRTPWSSRTASAPS